jgi:hypothetical protein
VATRENLKLEGVTTTRKECRKNDETMKLEVETTNEWTLYDNADTLWTIRKKGVPRRPQRRVPTSETSANE